ncbi:MAG TPA: acyl-CoA dehydrogenase, partial [Bacteroidales bacterium]|nr:acyl-CoA dehydrogenase [Bacteroidales bacterium]
AKTDAIRTLLYETARNIDIYKAIDDKAKYGSITPEEKQKLKKYQKIADILTPMLKLFSSEYANQITYDAIQVHGGSGFMKDYAVERMYRDARILTIYEGTSQLQVVAAIRGVINGGYIDLIKGYEAKEAKPEFSTMKKVLCQMRERFEQALERANSFGSNSEFYDFNSRRLVEMCGYLIMGHLLVIDANKNPMFTNSAELMIRMGQSKVEEAASFIMNFEESAIAKYKIAGDCKACAE